MRRAGADEVICDNFESGLKKIQGGSGTYFLILTRGHRYDGICLRAVLQKERAYIGMMASRGRAAAMKKELSGEGVSQETLEELHSPVGLSIHAETPSEIAVSIIAELIMNKNKKKKTSGYDDALLDCLRADHRKTGRWRWQRSFPEKAPLPERSGQR